MEESMIAEDASQDFEEHDETDLEVRFAFYSNV